MASYVRVERLAGAIIFESTCLHGKNACEGVVFSVGARAFPANVFFEK